MKAKEKKKKGLNLTEKFIIYRLYINVIKTVIPKLLKT